MNNVGNNLVNAIALNDNLKKLLKRFYYFPSHSWLCLLQQVQTMGFGRDFFPYRFALTALNNVGPQATTKYKLTEGYMIL